MSDELNVGGLTKPVTIQQLAESVGPSQFPVETWTTLYATAWMGREDVRGAERMADGQLSAQAMTRWTMRYVADMDPDLVNVSKVRRLLYGGRVYDIVRGEHIGRKDGIALTTIAKAG